MENYIDYLIAYYHKKVQDEQNSRENKRFYNR